MNLRQLNRILLQTSLLPVIALLGISGLLVWQILAAERAVNRIQLADQNINTASQIEAYLVDEESGLRGYQTTGNDIFLQPYKFARIPLADKLEELRSGVGDEKANERAVTELIAAHRQWISTIAIPLVISVDTGVDTRGTGLNLRGKAQMDAIRSKLRALSADQRTRRTAETERWQTLVRHTLQAVVGLALVIGLLLGAYTRARFQQILSAFQNAMTDLRRNVQATEASETRLRTTLRSIGDGVVVCDEQSRVEMLNPIAERLTGWSQADAFHQPVGAVVQLASQSTREPLTLEAVATTDGIASSSPDSALLIQQNGSALHVDARSAPILGRHGEATGSVTVIRDVSEQRRTQSALLAGEKQASAGRVAATIAHEIHNPLDAVVNLLYLMESGVSPDEATAFLATARSELDRVSQISRALLGMYRESREPIRLDLRELLESVVLLFNHQLLRASVRLETEFVGDLTVTGFPVELRQVFGNLLGNAADASDRGATIRLSAHEYTRVKPDGGAADSEAGVEVVISDHGGGIDPAAAPHLFEMFFTTKGERGTGLGLWVSHDIVQRHGGSLTFQSSTEAGDHGTSFQVFLPRAGALQESQAIAPVEESTVNEPSQAYS